MKEKELQKNGLIVLTLTTFGSALNYLCQIIMGRALSVADFGTINTIFSIMSITSVIGTTLSMLVSKYVAENLAENKYKEIKEYTYTILSSMGILSALVLLVGALIVSLLGISIGLKNGLIIYLTVIVLLINLFPIFFQGIFGGWQKFVALGLYTVIVPVFKLIGTILAQNNLYLVVISLIIANVISTIIGYCIVYITMKGYEGKYSLSHGVSCFKVEEYYIDSFVVNISMMFLMNIDILYLKIFCDSEVAGLYSSAILFGRIIYYCVTALAAVLLPMVSYAEKKQKDTYGMLKQTTVIILGLSIMLLVPVNLFAKQILVLVYGSQYYAAVQFVKWASVISVGTSLNTILVNYLLGRGNLHYLKKYLLLGVGIIIVLITLLQKRMDIVLLMLGVVLMLIFILNYYQIKIENKRREK